MGILSSNPSKHVLHVTLFRFFFLVNGRWLGDGVGYRNMLLAKIASGGVNVRAFCCSTLVFLPTQWTHGHHVVVPPFVFV